MIATATHSRTALPIFGAGNADFEHTAIHHLAIELLRDFLGSLFCCHFHKAKASRTTGFAVHDQVYRDDFAVIPRKDFSDVFRGHSIG